MSPIRIVFSDIDGTIAHYPDDDELKQMMDDDDYIKMPPSSTGTRGVLSRTTIERCQQLREIDDIKFILVSGMRTTTLYQRLPCLPLADAYCSENGGRIFYTEEASDNEDEDTVVFAPAGSDTKYKLVEDMEWRKTMSEVDACGPDGYNVTLAERPMADRKGVLWEFAALLKTSGWVFDTKGYATCFRIHMKDQTNSELRVEEDVTPMLPPTLTVTQNLGSSDVYPSISGKKNVCAYLAKKLIDDPDAAELSESCICLCDDDNDVAMALACRHAIVVSLSSDSIQEALNDNPDKILVASGEENDRSILGTTKASDEALKLALDLCSKKASSSS